MINLNVDTCPVKRRIVKIYYINLILILSSFNYVVPNQQENSLKTVSKDLFVGTAAGASGMVVYTPFHYFQNRTIQKLPIIKNPFV